MFSFFQWIPDLHTSYSKLLFGFIFGLLAVAFVMKTSIWSTIRRSPSTYSNVKFRPSTTNRYIDTSNSRDSQTCPLPDGRLLGYAEYGSQDGFPLMFFHGFPTSRLEGRALDKLGRRRRIRIIAPDRPGFGLSTFQARRSITDWPADVKALGDHLDISRFAILGGSGGGPYAVACASALPRETLASVGIMAGSPPWEAGMKEMPIHSRATALAVKYWPAGLKALADVLIGTVKLVLTTRTATKWIDNWLASVKRDADSDSSSVEERRERLLRIMFEGFAQGSEGFVHEAQLLSQDWGFRLEDVTYDKIQIWHGTKDTNAPIQMVRYMAEHLPHAVLHEYDEDSHWTIHRHLEEIVSELVPEEMSSVPELEMK